MQLARVSILLVALLSIATEVRAQAGLLVPTSSGRSDPKVLSLREMVIELSIARGYARVNVRQVFENHTGAIQEGTYRFALPPSAAVGDFAVWDGLVRIPGVILEKQRARAIYRELTQRRIDPGLLQQGEEEDRAASDEEPGVRPSGAALFSVTVAPIPARATKRLELQFQQEVPFIESRGEFRLVLKPPDGEPPVAKSLRVEVHLEDALFEAMPAGLPLTPRGDGASLSATNVPLDRDLVFRLRPRKVEPVRVTAFRNPEGRLPDGLALAPWERPADIPPETDGFFLVEVTPPAIVPAAAAGVKTPPAAPGARRPLTLAILFDTSLSQRWAGLELAYAYLVRVLRMLDPADQFALIAFDRAPSEVALRRATPPEIDAALATLRERSLGPGTDVAAALAEARKTAGARGRVLLFTDGQGPLTSRALKAAVGPLPLFTAVTTGEAVEALRAASAQVLARSSTEIETDLFFKRVLAPEEAPAVRSTRPASALPFTVSGGDPKTRDVYPVLVQPPSPGSLSGWVGRYAVPQPRVRVEVTSALFAAGRQAADAALPEKALAARDLPRRWARARVDDLLARIEADGERQDLIEEVIALSTRYKFVTPYTAFLAAPRSLLRPRRIQPGDPVLRVECDAATVSATALFPFGLKLDLTRRPATNLWEGRFLVPEGLKDGRYGVRILIHDASGARISETKHFVLDGTPPTILPDPLPAARTGDTVRVSVRTDADVIVLTARMAGAPPVPLRWDPASQRSVGLLRVPAGVPGVREILFEAVDGAKNHSFARTTLEVGR